MLKADLLFVVPTMLRGMYSREHIRDVTEERLAVNR